MNASQSRLSLRPAALALLAAGLSLAGPASAAKAADEAVVASLNPPPPGLSCVDAAAQTSVYFQFARPTFAVSQISLYLDGKGVPAEAVEQHWPTVTLSQGLHPGRNTVDIVAEGRGGQRLTRRLVVLVGPAAGGDAAAPATVACDEALAEGDEGQDAPEVIEEPPPVVVETQPPVIYQQPPVIYQQPPVIYETAPVYVYRPYPTFAFDAFVPLVPFFGFSFFYSNYHPYCPPPRAVYRSSPDYRWHGGGRDSWRDAEGWHGRDDGWRQHDGRGDWRDDGRDHDRGGHRGDDGRYGSWNGGSDRGREPGGDHRPRDPVGSRPAIIDSHTTIETDGGRRDSPRGPQGPDNWHGRALPNPDAPHGERYRPIAPAPDWHPQPPTAPNRDGEPRRGDRAAPPGPPNVIHNEAPSSRSQPPPQPAPQPQQGGQGRARGGEHGGDHGGDRGGERRHDNR